MEIKEATIKDLEFLLDSHNKNMEFFFNQNKVSMEEHTKWFENHKGNIFIPYLNGERIGCFMVSDYEDGKELHWELLPEYRGIGLGEKFLSIFIKKFTGRLVARIKEDNIASIKLAKKVGFIRLKDNLYEMFSN